MNDNSPERDIKKILEALLFCARTPLTVEQLSHCFDPRPKRDDIVRALTELMNDYQTHAIELTRVSSGYRFQTRPIFSPWISRLWEEKPTKYSRAFLETLSIIAYRQPVTRGDIEEIRGVAVSSNIMKSLIERAWVKQVGHRDVPGKPGIYATTKLFLDYFNLSSLEDLPSLMDIKSAEQLSALLEPKERTRDSMREEEIEYEE